MGFIFLYYEKSQFSLSKYLMVKSLFLSVEEYVQTIVIYTQSVLPILVI